MLQRLAAAQTRTGINPAGQLAAAGAMSGNNKLFNPFADEEKSAAGKPGFSFYSDPLAAFTQGVPGSTAGAQTRTSAPPAAAVPGPRPPPGAPLPALQQQGWPAAAASGVPGPRPPPGGPPPQQQQQQYPGPPPAAGGLGMQAPFQQQQQQQPYQQQQPGGFGMTWQQQQQQQPGAWGGGGGRGRGRGGQQQQQHGGGRGRGGRGGRGAKVPRTDAGPPDGSRFFKHSFLEDPWEPLMRQLKQQHHE